MRRKKMKPALLFFVLCTVLALAACATKETPQPAAPGAAAAAPQGVQIANPASVNCEKKGGKLEIVDEEAGQKGICTLPDGTKCEEWAYFRGECP
jgi:uncharacterized protein